MSNQPRSLLLPESPGGMAASPVPLLYLGNQKLRVGMGEITCSSGLLQTFRLNWVLVLGHAEWMPLPPQVLPPPHHIQQSVLLLTGHTGNLSGAGQYFIWRKNREYIGLIPAVLEFML